MTPEHVEQGAPPTLTLGVVSDEIDRPSCDRRRHCVVLSDTALGWVVHVDVTDVTKIIKRQKERQISHVDMGEGAGGKDLAVWSTGFWARLRVRVSRRSRYQGTLRRNTHAPSCGVDRIALCPTRSCTGP